MWPLQNYLINNHNFEAATAEKKNAFLNTVFPEITKFIAKIAYA